MDLSDDIKSTDTAIAVGAAYERDRLSFEGRYTFGLTDVGKDESEPGHPKHSVIGILAGVRF